MSGGHFNYDQQKIGNIIDSIEWTIEHNRKPISEEDRDYWVSEKYYHGYSGCEEFYHDYSDDVIDRMKMGVHYLKMAQVYAQRIDWFISGDDGEESFITRLNEDLCELNKEHRRQLLAEIMQADQESGLYDENK